MSTPWLAVSEHPPTVVGWYATTNCWDPEEGIFPDANYWTGSNWASDAPVSQRSDMTFDGPDDARAWAYAHDAEDEPS